MSDTPKNTFGSAGEIKENLSAAERDWYRRVFAGARAQAEETLSALDATDDRNEKAKQLALLAHLAHEGMDAHAQSVFEAGAEGAEAQAAIACKQGCHFCCHVNVMVTIPEAFLIASFLRFDGRDDLVAAVKATAPKIAGMAPRERHKTATPCPLLDEDGSCGVHELRPNACRAYYSPDAKLCEASLQAARDTGTPAKVPTLAFPHQISAAYYSGVTEALGEAGLQNCGVELTAALDLIFRDERAMERWLGGEQVFREYKKD